MLTNKVVTMSIIKKIKPTESELEILQILWQRESATVREVHEELSKNKTSGYTTTLKLMQIMHDKGLLYRTQQGRAHIYVALLGKEETQQNLLCRLVDNAFQGSAAQLVMYAITSQTFSKEELNKICELIKSIENK